MQRPASTLPVKKSPRRKTADVTKGILFAHTHWDREWYRTFQQFQYSLVEMMDRLIDTLEADPEYRQFHVDGHTLVLHDYLEIRPENRPRIEELVRSGRLIIGPFYMLGDDFLQSGESHVRNLLMGRRDCLALGGTPMNVGYYTDTFGHGAQTPQILRGFSIDTAILFRGINARDRGAAYFNWEAADGSSVFTHLLHSFRAYSNFFFSLWDHTDYLSPEAIQSVIKEIEFQVATTESDVVLLADGIDHAFVRPNLPQIAKEIGKATNGAMEVEFDSLENFLQIMQKKFGAKARRVSGELFDTNAETVNLGGLATNSISSRQTLKTLSHRLETHLSRYAEPMAVLAHLQGQPYPRSFLNKAWQLLLQNQVHDSIGGCSIDRVHQDMEHRFHQVQDIAQVIYRRSLLSAARGTGVLNDFFGGKTLSIFNPTLVPFSGVLETIIHWPETETAPVGLFLRDAKGNIIETRISPAGSATPAEYLETKKTVHGRRWRAYKLQFEIADLPGMTVAYYEIVPRASDQNSVDAMAARNFFAQSEFKNELTCTARSLENKWLRLEVESDGNLVLLDKTTGNRFSGLLTFEDRGDVGDGWIKTHPQNDQITHNSGTPISVSLISPGPLRGSLRLEMKWDLPASFDLAADKRSDARAVLPIKITLHLDANARHLDAEIEVDNTIRDHCLRALFPSDTSTDTYQSDTEFVVNDRPVHADPKSDYAQPQPPTRPMYSFLNIESRGRGLAVISASGHRECEVLPSRNTLALTLFRSTQKTVGTNGENDGQLLHKQTFQLRIIPHAGSWVKSQIPILADSFNCPPLVQQLNLENSCPPSKHLLQASSGSAVLSAYKLAETNDDIVCRLWEPHGKPSTLSIKLPSLVKKIGEVQLNEEPIGASRSGNTISAKLGPRKIYTFRAGS